MLLGKKKHEMSDEELVEKFRSSGRKEWAGELFNRHAHLVFGTCLKYLKDKDNAQDATMNIFLLLLEDMPTSEFRSFPSWLYVVTKNHCLMQLRKKQHEKVIDDRQWAGIKEDENTTPELELQLKEMESALQELKPAQRQCIELFYLQKKSYEEIAQETGHSMKEVKSHLQNGRRNLRIILDKTNENAV